MDTRQQHNQTVQPAARSSVPASWPGEISATAGCVKVRLKESM